MKFLIDANLPFKLALLLKNKGYEIIHTDNLKNKERTTDNEIRKIALEENYIVWNLTINKLLSTRNNSSY